MSIKLNSKNMEYFVRRLRGKYAVMCRIRRTKGIFFKKQYTEDCRVNLFGGPLRISSVIPPMPAFDNINNAIQCANRLSEKTQDFDLNGKPIKNRKNELQKDHKDSVQRRKTEN